jgi:hypothetical protein
MRTLLYICGVVCFALVPTDIAVAKLTRLQTVNLTGMKEFMSTEGGEARLYRTGDVKHGVCRIEAYHFGEMGKAIYVFDFGSKLYAAERREYRYNAFFYTTRNLKVTLTERTTLASLEGRNSLPKDFEAYKALFEARKLAECFGR